MNAKEMGARPAFPVSFGQYLRQGALAATDGKPVQERADALNLIEAIIDGEMSTDDLIEAIKQGSVPVRYAPAKEQSA